MDYRGNKTTALCAYCGAPTFLGVTGPLKVEAARAVQCVVHAIQAEIRGESVATLLGITFLHASKVNATFPYTLTQVAEQLGYGYWSYANQLLDVVKEQTGFDVKGSDNTYHITMRTGKKSWTNTRKRLSISSPRLPRAKRTSWLRTANRPRQRSESQGLRSSQKNGRSHLAETMESGP